MQHKMAKRDFYYHSYKDFSMRTPQASEAVAYYRNRPMRADIKKENIRALQQMLLRPEEEGNEAKFTLWYKGKFATFIELEFEDAWHTVAYMNINECYFEREITRQMKDVEELMIQFCAKTNMVDFLKIEPVTATKQTRKDGIYTTYEFLGGKVFKQEKEEEKEEEKEKEKEKAVVEEKEAPDKVS